MKNPIILCLLFISSFSAFAQTTSKSDYGRNIPPYYFYGFDYAHMDFSNAKVADNDSLVFSINSINTTEDFVMLHVNVVGLTTQCPVNATIDIFYNSDFIKDSSGKVESGKFNTNLSGFGLYATALSAPSYFGATDT